MDDNISRAKTQVSWFLKQDILHYIKTYTLIATIRKDVSGKKFIRKYGENTAYSILVYKNYWCYHKFI